MVTMIAPEGETTVLGQSGWRYSVGRIEIDADDVGPLRGAGFVAMQ